MLLVIIIKQKNDLFWKNDDIFVIKFVASLLYKTIVEGKLRVEFCSQNGNFCTIH